MSYTNAEIARLFDNLAEMLELKRALPFKFRAYRRAAQVIRELPEPLEALVLQATGEDGAATALRRIPGIGPAIAGKVVELVPTGRVAAYEREKARAPPALQSRLHAESLGRN